MKPMSYVLTACAIRRSPKKMYKEALFNPDVNCGYIQSVQR
jgi:hypothetical protein